MKLPLLSLALVLSCKQAPTDAQQKNITRVSEDVCVQLMDTINYPFVTDAGDYEALRLALKCKSKSNEDACLTISYNTEAVTDGFVRAAIAIDVIGEHQNKRMTVRAEREHQRVEVAAVNSKLSGSFFDNDVEVIESGLRIEMGKGKEVTFECQNITNKMKSLRSEKK
jgi:hypothetical protein